jgi:hypothetical protein
MLESKTFRVWFGVTILMCVISCGQAFSCDQDQAFSCDQALSAQEKPYHIGIGDVLQVSIWRHPELSRTTPVKPDGKITLPLLKELKVSGLSPMDLLCLVRHKLERKIPNPQVTVIVKWVKSAHPGVYLEPSPQEDTPSPELLDALPKKA